MENHRVKKQMQSEIVIAHAPAQITSSSSFTVAKNASAASIAASLGEKRLTKPTVPGTVDSGKEIGWGCSLVARRSY